MTGSQPGPVKICAWEHLRITRPRKNGARRNWTIKPQGEQAFGKTTSICNGEKHFAASLAISSNENQKRGIILSDDARPAGIHPLTPAPIGVKAARLSQRRVSNLRRPAKSQPTVRAAILLMEIIGTPQPESHSIILKNDVMGLAVFAPQG